MNKIGYLILFIFIILIVIPLVMLKGFLFFQKQEGPEVIRVYNYREDKVVTMELSDYLKGVVAAEMPATYKMEALKAQAVAARTYTLKKIEASSEKHPGADICTDYHCCQAWISEKEMKDRWGFLPYFYYWSRITNAVEDTKGEVIVYNNQLIDAVYHSNSGGKTEDGGVVWSEDVPYLKSVESPYDKNGRNNYLHNKRFSFSELSQELGTEIKNKKIEILELSQSGRVLKIQIGDNTYTGREIRSKLNLSSTLFEIKTSGEQVLFTVYGNGHGVGMSQDGADGYARHGYNYKQIIRHFYQGVEIVSYNKIK